MELHTIPKIPPSDHFTIHLPKRAVKLPSPPTKFQPQLPTMPSKTSQISPQMVPPPTASTSNIYTTADKCCNHQCFHHQRFTTNASRNNVYDTRLTIVKPPNDSAPLANEQLFNYEPSLALASNGPPTLFLLVQSLSNHQTCYFNQFATDGALFCTLSYRYRLSVVRSIIFVTFPLHTNGKTTNKLFGN